MADLIFIGTGSGKTSLNRYYSSLLFKTSDYNLLIDAGDGLSRALLSQKIDLSSIDGILITHLHPDHYTGLASLIVQMKMLERKKKLDIYSDNSFIDFIRQFFLQSYLFPERLGFQLNYKTTYENKDFKINDNLSFLPRENSHLDSVSKLKCYESYSFSCSSILVEVENKKIHYTSDIGSKGDLTLFDDYKCKYLISEVAHVQPEDIIKHFDQSNSPERIILTHINQEDEVFLNKYISALTEEIREKTILAYDGLKLTL